MENKKETKIEKKKNSLYEQWWFWVIILCITIIISFTILRLKGVNKSQKIDGSNMMSYELIEMFEKEGYEFRITEILGQTGTYIILENDSNGVTIQRIINTLLGNMMTFDDDTINDEMADLIETNRNDTIEKTQQYTAYEEWLKKYNITKVQLVNMLDYYYENNSQNKEVIDVESLINNYNN